MYLGISSTYLDFIAKPYFAYKELKLRLDWLLEYKLSHPGHVSWNDSSSDITLLK